MVHDRAGLTLVHSHGLRPGGGAGSALIGRPSPTRRLRERYRALKGLYEDLLRQMRLAEEVQKHLPPRELPEPPGVRFAAGLRPTMHMAGDFYSAFRLDAEHVGFYLGDVMGHGPASALLSVFAMVSMRAKRISGHHYELVPPSEALEHLSRELLALNLPGQPFLTMVYGVLNTTERTWTYCCGGHPHPVLLRDGEPPRYLETTGPLLGVLELPFLESRVTLARGDRLVLHSDGVSTVQWGDRGFGVDGLCAWLERSEGATTQEQLDRALSVMTVERPLADDVAVLIAEVVD